jgi:anti-anti-sigma factor
MKRHHIAMAASVGRYEHGAPAAPNRRQSAATNRSRLAQRASGDDEPAPPELVAREHTLILTGGLDGASALSLEAEIERLCEEGVSAIALDLRELTYIDRVGVAVIAFRCGLCQRRGHGFMLIPGRPAIHRVFEQAGVAELLPFGEREPLHVLPEPAVEPAAAAAAQRRAPVQSQRKAPAAARFEGDLGAPALVPALAMGPAAGGGER